MPFSTILLTSRFVVFSLCLLFFAAASLPLSADDCNRNGVEDELDINSETSLDCD